MKRNFVFVGVIFALSAFLIGLMSLTQNVVNAQTTPKRPVAKAPIAGESKTEQEAVKVPESVEALKIPDWWTNPPNFANHIIFGRGVAIFRNLTELQDAKNLAETNARYAITAKLGSRINMQYDGHNMRVYENANFSVSSIREFKSKIVKADGCFAYYTLHIFSYYNYSLRLFDKTYSQSYNYDFFKPIKKIFEDLQKHGVFDPTNLDYDKPFSEKKEEPQKPVEPNTTDESETQSEEATAE